MASSNLNQCEEETGNVSRFFNGKSIFITGATGFMGKVLVEKLLRSCPGIVHIYLLVREKKKKDPYARIKEMITLPLFDVVRKERPTVFEKLKPVIGDVTELGLGLSDEDRELLEQEVNIVFHAAASVRFDDSLAYATILNVRGTREVVKLAMRMKKLQVFVHISTTYCNLHETVVVEKMYPPPADWQEMISIAEKTDDLTLRILTTKILGTYPNTYTFTKGLAEHLVNDYCDKIPVIIIRPSILISTAVEPFPGWVDTFNGPVGLLYAAAMGVVHVSYTRSSCVADFMPVDVAVNATLISVWKKGTESHSKETSVYQCSSAKMHEVTMKQMLDIGRSKIWDTPLGYCIWYPSGFITDNRVIYSIMAFILHVIPAVGIDFLLMVAGKKPILLKVARRIYMANTALSYFMLHEWVFVNEKARALENELRGPDVETFSYHIPDTQPDIFLTRGIIGARKYLLKKNMDSIESERRHMKRMYYLSIVTNAICAGLVLWCIYYLFAT